MLPDNALRKSGRVMAKAGTFLGLISPVFAVGAVALMLFVPTYSYESGSCRSGHIGQPWSSDCSHESGTISALRAALEEGDSTLLDWAGLVVILSLIAAVGALAG
jgi:hypothetical protein